MYNSTKAGLKLQGMISGRTKTSFRFSKSQSITMESSRKMVRFIKNWQEYEYNFMVHLKHTVDHYGNNPYKSMNVENPNWSKPFLKTFEKGADEMGLRFKDLNGPQTEGYGVLETNQDNGKRSGTYYAFLQNILSRPNLSISRYSQVIKVQYKDIIVIRNDHIKVSHSTDHV